MLTYSHRDALLCAPCAEFVALNDRRKPRLLRSRAYDCPQHCERCGVFLRNQLTQWAANLFSGCAPSITTRSRRALGLPLHRGARFMFCLEC
jgi:hypothetical protein